MSDRVIPGRVMIVLKDSQEKDELVRLIASKAGAVQSINRTRTKPNLIFVQYEDTRVTDHAIAIMKQYPNFQGVVPAVETARIANRPMNEYHSSGNSRQQQGGRSDDFELSSTRPADVQQNERRTHDNKESQAAEDLNKTAHSDSESVQPKKRARMESREQLERQAPERNWNEKVDLTGSVVQPSSSSVLQQTERPVPSTSAAENIATHNRSHFEGNIQTKINEQEETVRVLTTIAEDIKEMALYNRKMFFLKDDYYRMKMAIMEHKRTEAIRPRFLAPVVPRLREPASPAYEMANQNPNRPGQRRVSFAQARKSATSSVEPGSRRGNLSRKRRAQQSGAGSNRSRTVQKGRHRSLHSANRRHSNAKPSREPSAEREQDPKDVSRSKFARAAETDDDEK